MFLTIRIRRSWLGFEEWVFQNVVRGVRDGNFSNRGSPQHPERILGLVRRQFGGSWGARSGAEPGLESGSRCGRPWICLCCGHCRDLGVSDTDWHGGASRCSGRWTWQLYEARGGLEIRQSFKNLSSHHPVAQEPQLFIASGEIHLKGVI